MRSCVTVDELLDVAEELEFAPEELQSWWKIGDTRGPRVYVKKADRQGLATEIHLSGFSIEDDLVTELTEEEARQRHLGNVRGIIRQAAFTPEARDQLIQLFRQALDELVDSAHAALPRTRGAPQLLPTHHGASHR